MTGPKIGALFAGYGGLDLAVTSVYGGSLAWYSEVDKGALKILAHRFPDVPNVGDVTTADWSQVEPVDILTGGSPCQDLSHAGRRAGMTEGTRSNLWVAMREAIAQLRPGLVVWENVRGALSAEAASAVEPCAGCVGDRPGVSLRALGRVVGDLSELGYVGRWHGLRAADVGAPHGRWRVFLAATDARRIGGRQALEHDGGSASAVDWSGVPDESDEVEHLLPTPSAATPDSRRSTRDGETYSADGYTREQLGDVVASGAWGDYAAAIARWEQVLGRPAPAPTMNSTKGNPQLSPVFVEWLMGLPAGWVTDVPGITRNEALKALGNGVVPQQAAAAMRVMAASEAAA